ncbi:uncharacterized protein EV420DRAFT_1577490, partial [Desarmillaria tabescens]
MVLHILCAIVCPWKSYCCHGEPSQSLLVAAPSLVCPYIHRCTISISSCLVAGHTEIWLITSLSFYSLHSQLITLSARCHLWMLFLLSLFVCFFNGFCI